MALPKIQHPIFDLKIPSLNKTVKFRPFLVKEEKILLTAQSAGDKTDIITSLVQIINNCALEDINAENLATFDLEYLFIKLRARSVNNIIEIKYKDADDQKEYPLSIDLDKIEVKFNSENNNTVKISDSVSLKLGFPKPGMIDSLKQAANPTEVYFKILAHTLEYVIDNNVTTDVRDVKFEEVEEFIENLNIASYKEIEKFVETLPVVSHEASYTNSKGALKVVKLEGLEDFFTLG